MKKQLLLGLLILLCAAPGRLAEANTINAASCSQADVQTAINTAVSGDTVLLPGGTCTWASQLAVDGTKILILNGGGATITGTLDITANSSTSSAMRVTNFTWLSNGNCSIQGGGVSNAITTHSTVSTGWVRIDHNTFSENTNGTMVCLEGDGTHNLVDNNTFTLGSSSGGAEVIHVFGGGSGQWATDVLPGGPDMNFIETNTFTYNCSSGCNFGGTSAVQSYYGARTVFRYNQVTDMQVDQHGTCGQVWARWWELYYNTFIVSTNVNQSNYFAIRGGSGVIFGNTVTNPGNNTGGGYLELADDCNGTYPDTYQVGRGINQALSPAYLWATSNNMTISAHLPQIALNRDYYVSTSQPATLTRCESAADVTAGCPVSYNYVPYVYPHPFVTAGAPAVSQVSQATVNQGTTMQFTASDAGTWSCPGCAGSINSSTGLYTAPATVTAQQTLGGYQLLPNNHIYNTRIDSLAVNPNNTAWMNVANTGQGQPGYDGVGMPINYITNSAPTKAMKFFYTPANNSPYQIAQFPDARMENGYFRGISVANGDHHFLHFNTSNGTIEEFYQFYASCPTSAASVNGSNVATLTCTNNPITEGFLVGSNIYVGGFTGGDTYFNVGPVALSAVTATTISYPLTHAPSSATSNGSASFSSSATPNSQSGLVYNAYDYALPANGTTDAAGMVLIPLENRLQEWNRAVASGGTINHAVRFTQPNTVLCQCFIWPATANSTTPNNIVPYGSRMRLKSSFDISGYSAAAQVLLKQLKQYGIIAADGGNGWAALGAEANRWPANYIQAIADVSNAGPVYTITNSALTGNVATITATNSLATNDRVFINNSNNANCVGCLNGWWIVASATGSSFTFNFTHANIASAADTGTVRNALANFMEFVDESGIEIFAGSGATTTNREPVTFTRTSDGATTIVDVALQGVAVDFSKDYLDIMAGTPAQQLTALVNIGGVTWTMSPTVGTLTSGGLYTAPASVGSPTTTTITATSTVNSSVTALLNVTVYPGPALRLLPAAGTNYTDTFGNTWYAGCGLGTNQPVNSTSCNTNGSFPMIANYKLWNTYIGGATTAADTRIDMLVPNGVYEVTYRFGSVNASGVATNKFAVQGNVVATQDPSAVAGGANLPFSVVSQNVTVTDNHLKYTIYTAMGGSFDGSSQPISSISIIPGAVRPRSGGFFGGLP